ncbi:MAG: MFS transporter [Ornithinibacter sp.]
MEGFHRDRLTWLLYAMLAWFAYLQAVPGLVVPRLRDELGFSYSVGGLHVAAFAAGSAVAGAVSARLERAVGRGMLLWSAAAVMATGAGLLTVAGAVPATIGSIALMGAGGGMLLATVQAGLSEHHGEQRGVALTEANVAAAASYLLLTGVLLAVGALGLGWRAALLLALLVPVLAFLSNRRTRIDAAAPSDAAVPRGRLPGVFWVAAVMLMCAVAAEWCVTAWGATFVQQAAASTPDAAVAVMAGYFVGVLAGRVLGSGLTRRYDPAVLLGVALGVALLGFALLWPSTGPVQAAAGLTLLGVGIGNLFPMGVSVAVGLAPGRSATASGRVVVVTAVAILLAPLTVGTLADATSLKAALVVVPVLVCLAAVALGVVVRARAPAVVTASAP